MLLDLSPIAKPGDIAGALGAVAGAAAAGEMSTEEGGVVASILETQRRAVETVEFERRLAALEQATKARLKSGQSLPPS